MTSNGDSLGTESTIQVPRNAASDLVSRMGHSWIRRDTVVDGLGKASARLRTAEWRQEISDAMKLGVVLHHLPDASLREHLLLNSRVHDTYALMAAEVRTVAMARTTWSGPTPMDPSILAKDAVCHVCGKKGHFAKDCWHQSGNKGSGKGKKGKKRQERPRERHKTQGW